MADRLPIPNPSAQCSELGTGTIEVSASDDGMVLVSFMAREGGYRWWKMPAANAVGLSAALSSRAADLLEKEPPNSEPKA